MKIVELRSYIKTIDAVLNDEEQRQLQNLLVLNEKAGELIQGTGGFRKLRFSQSSKNKGKRSGIRVIYYFKMPSTLYLVLAYAKGRQDSLSAEQKKALKGIASQLKQER